MTRRGNSTAQAISCDKDLVSSEEQRKWDICDDSCGGTCPSSSSDLLGPWAEIGWNLVKLGKNFTCLLIPSCEWELVVVKRLLRMKWSNPNKTAITHLVPECICVRKSASHLSNATISVTCLMCDLDPCFLRTGLDNKCCPTWAPNRSVSNNPGDKQRHDSSCSCKEL